MAKAGRGRGNGSGVTLDQEWTCRRGENQLDLLDLDEALTQLARLDARKHRIVELRFFGGCRWMRWRGCWGSRRRA